MTNNKKISSPPVTEEEDAVVEGKVQDRSEGEKADGAVGAGPMGGCDVTAEDATD